MATSKERTVVQQGDLILVYFKQFPHFFARVEWIIPDEKKGWWRVCLLKIGMPLERIEWILDDNHMNCEPFMMKGVPMKLQIVPHEFPEEEKVEPVKPKVTSTPDKVVSLFGDKK